MTAAQRPRRRGPITGPITKARRAARVERVALDTALVHMRNGDRDKALGLLVLVDRALENLRVKS